MKIQKFSFNVHGNFIQDEAKLLKWVAENNPTTMTVLDNPKLASKIADLGVPYVILRITPNDDKLHMLVNSFAEWWRVVKNNYTDKRLFVYVFNEPIGHRDRVNQLALEGMDILASEGLRGVFGNFNVGGYEDEEIKVTLRMMLSKLSNEYAGYHLLGVHEGYMYEPEYSVPYLSGRYRSIVDLYPNIRIVLTEFGVDYIEDVIKRFPGANIRGWKQHYEYWKQQGVQNPTEYMLNHFKFLGDTLYSDEAIIGVNFYCYGNSGGWDLYNIEHDEDFLDNMDKLEMETTIPVNTPTVIKANSSAGTNRRTGAGTNFSKSKILLTEQPTVVTELERSGAWIKYRFEDGDFWVHSDFIIVVTQGKNVTLTLYDATDQEIEEIKSLIPFLERTAELFKKLRVEIT